MKKQIYCPHTPSCQYAEKVRAQSIGEGIIRYNVDGSRDVRYNCLALEGVNSCFQIELLNKLELILVGGKVVRDRVIPIPL